MALRLAPRETVTPLEIWNHQVDGQSLFAWQKDRSFARRVVKAASAFDPEVVYIAGGRDDLELIARHVHYSGRRCIVDAAGPFAGVLGAARLGGPHALGVDIGQTSIKVWWGEKQLRIARDWEALPLETPEMLPEERAAGEETLVMTVEDAVAQVTGNVARPKVAVVAVPAEIDAACIMQGSSYPYAAPNARLLQRIAEATGAPEVIACNDAELVAHSAASVVGSERTLVLTFGWGVGAALLNGR